MLTSSEIKNISFSKSLNGYKREEVENFLDIVEADLAKYEKLLQENIDKCNALQLKIDEFNDTKNNIQQVLINAQSLADKIINDAKTQSEEIVLKAEENINIITAKEKELASLFEQKALQRKNDLEIELNSMIEKANMKASLINQATNDCIKQQQMLFDKLKLEVSSFKSSITAKYKEHLSVLQEIPEFLNSDPEKIAEIINAKVDTDFNIETFVAQKNVNETNKEDDNFGFVVSEEIADNL